MKNKHYFNVHRRSMSQESVFCMDKWKNNNTLPNISHVVKQILTRCPICSSDEYKNITYDYKHPNSKSEDFQGYSFLRGTHRPNRMCLDCSTQYFYEDMNDRNDEISSRNDTVSISTPPPVPPGTPYQSPSYINKSFTSYFNQKR